MSYFGFVFRAVAAFTQLSLNEMNEVTQCSTDTLIIIPIVHFCLLFLLLILFMIQYVVP